jgi:hypothetical protein
VLQRPVDGRAGLGVAAEVPEDVGVVQATE